MGLRIHGTGSAIYLNIYGPSETHPGGPICPIELSTLDLSKGHREGLQEYEEDSEHELEGLIRESASHSEVRRLRRPWNHFCELGRVIFVPRRAPSK